MKKHTPVTNRARWQLSFPWSLLWGGLTAGLIIAACAAGGDTTGAGGQAAGGDDFDGGTNTGGLDPNAACATASDEAKLVPVNIYIMFDKSGSMLGSLWADSTAALQSFFMDPQSAGLRIALRFFPDEGCDAGCNVAACSQPKVPLGELTNLSAPTDTHEDALINAFVDVNPGGGTPLSAALDGALLWATNTLQMHPTEKTAVVLVTDGDPEDCQTDTSYFVNAAQAAYTNQGIVTFAIGLEGSSESLMNHIAAAGGSGQGVFIGTANAQQELIDAFNSIRGSTIACDYVVPEAVEGQNVDPRKVNVLYYPHGGPDPSPIGKVANEEACTAGQGGWYYDDPDDPKRIILCPATCSEIRSDPNAELDLLFGCETFVA